MSDKAYNGNNAFFFINVKLHATKENGFDCMYYVVKMKKKTSGWSPLLERIQIFVNHTVVLIKQLIN